MRTQDPLMHHITDKSRQILNIADLLSSNRCNMAKNIEITEQLSSKRHKYDLSNTQTFITHATLLRQFSPIVEVPYYFDPSILDS